MGINLRYQRKCAISFKALFQLHIIIFFIKFIYVFLFLAALGLRCCVWAFSSCVERGLLFDAVSRLLIAVASPVEEHGF